MSELKFEDKIVTASVSQLVNLSVMPFSSSPSMDVFHLESDFIFGVLLQGVEYITATILMINRF